MILSVAQNFDSVNYTFRPIDSKAVVAALELCQHDAVQFGVQGKLTFL